jgi:Holliday junction resolvase RusA-like endonuclease
MIIKSERVRDTFSSKGGSSIMASPAVLVPAVAFTVMSSPEPGGNKSGFPIYRGSAAKGTREFTGRVVVAEQNKKVPAWRRAVMDALRPEGPHGPLIAEPVSGPLVVKFWFSLERGHTIPKSRIYPHTKPDCSKLVRATEDAITDSGLWEDDARVVAEVISKAYVGWWHADGTDALQVPGCVVEIFTIGS